MSVSTMDRFAGLRQRPDFRRNAVKAIWRRLLWKARWLTITTPWPLTLGKDLEIALPNGGAGALIYYQGFSEPDTADFLLKFLKPGMVFLDVGAHVGEYTLLAAQAVGTTGEIHAFEANPEIFSLLRDNINRNKLKNVNLQNYAVSDVDGKTEFEIYAEPAVCSIHLGNKLETPHRKVLKLISVPCIRLDTYLNGVRRKVDLVKIDVEGAEQLVFLGAIDLFGLPKNEAPTLIFECELNNYARFGYEPKNLFQLLWRYDFTLWCYSADTGLQPLRHDALPNGTINLIATKDEKWLQSILNISE